MPEEISITGEIKRMLERQPFRPFVIILTSGDRYEVTGLHQLAIGESVAILLPPNSTSIYMRTNQIAAIEELQQAA
jgi:hypothetical protein